MTRKLRHACLLAACLLIAPGVFAYPEYQKFSQSNSGRNVNCAMCHEHPDGPEGVKAGQIGSLDQADLQRLNEARKAFEPGLKVDSPILNAFGDHIAETLGRREFIAMRRHPEQLGPALGSTSDLDGDGLPDAREYEDGTHPLDPNHGTPWLLFLHNLRQQQFHLIMIVLATLFGLFGLNNALRGLARSANGTPREARDERESG